MASRRDLFLMVPAPGRADEAEAFMKRWLGEIDGHPGYLGGAVLRESAKELPDDTMVLVLEFESTPAAKALWPKIEGKLTPIEPDVPGVQPPDQGGALFDDDAGSNRSDAGHGHSHDRGHALEHLEFNRGGGLFARLLHAHCEVAYEYTATGTGPGAAEVGSAAH